MYFKRLRLEAMHLHLPGGVGWVGKVRTCLKIVGVNGIYMLIEGEHNCVLRGWDWRQCISTLSASRGVGLVGKVFTGVHEGHQGVQCVKSGGIVLGPCQNLPEDCGCEWYIHVDGGGT